MSSINKRVDLDAKMAIAIKKLRAHLMKCGQCKNAMKSAHADEACQLGLLMVMNVAVLTDHLWRIKQAAYANPDGWVYVCPNIELHGPTAAVTAAPCYVTAYQDKLA